MKFTLKQYGIIRELVAHEGVAVAWNLANMEEELKRNNDTLSDDEYQKRKAEIAEVKKIYNELNRILVKFDEDEL